MKSIIVYFIILVSSIGVASANWLEGAKSLFGVWRSVKMEGYGSDDQVIKIVLNTDGSCETVHTLANKREDKVTKTTGIFLVGNGVMYIEDKGEDQRVPQSATLFTLERDEGKLVLKNMRSKRENVIVLEKTGEAPK